MKLYLFEKDIIQPLNKHLEKRKMQLAEIETKCSGLEVMTPVPISDPSHEDKE